MACPICEKRKPKRFCPAKDAQICPRCCGEHREVTIACPLDCRYLRESRERDYSGDIDPKDFPHKEVEIEAAFLREHGELVETCGRAVFEGTLAVPGAVAGHARPGGLVGVPVDVAGMVLVQQHAPWQQRVTAVFRREHGRSLHVRKATRAETGQQAIYDALGIDASPGGVRKLVV